MKSEANEHEGDLEVSDHLLVIDAHNIRSDVGALLALTVKEEKRHKNKGHDRKRCADVPFRISVKTSLGVIEKILPSVNLGS